jgi:hypothetical protein
VVDDNEVGDETEGLAWHRIVRRRLIGKTFDLPDRLPADEADETAGERWVLREPGCLPLLVEVSELGERATFDAVTERAFGRDAVVEPAHVIAVLGEHAERRDPHEREA